MGANATKDNKDLIKNKIQQAVENQQQTLSLCGLKLTTITKLDGSFDSITQIDLSNNRIELLPKWLVARFPNVKVLKLNGNKLLEIPKGINYFTSLTHLELKRNQLTSIKMLTGLSLITLDVSDNKIVELDQNEKLQKTLQRLYCTGNKLKKFPTSLIENNNLIELDISDNTEISSQDVVKNAGMLKKLVMRKCNLSKFPKFISPLTLLTELDLSRNQLTEIDESIKQLCNLVKLDLGFNKLNKLPDFSSITTLEELVLTSNELSDLPELSTSLKKLFIGSNKLQNFPNCISSLSELVELSFERNPVSENWISILEKSDKQCFTPKLNTVRLSKCNLIEVPEYFVNAYLMNVTSLDISGNQIHKLPVYEAFSKLTQLVCNENQIVEIPESISNLTGLSKLQLRFNHIKKLPDSLFKLTNLQVLDLRSNKIDKLPGNISKLTNLHQLLLDRNNLIKLPVDELLQMTALKKLDCINNGLDAIPKEMKEAIDQKRFTPTVNIFMDKPNKIVEQLYLGSFEAAANRAVLIQNKITHVLTVADLETPHSDLVTYKRVAVEDKSSTNLLPHFEECINFIQDAIDKKGTVLVHCAQGISRSASVVTAYIMKTKKMPFEKALNFVIAQRKQVCPNNGFRKQLEQYQKQLGIQE